MTALRATAGAAHGKQKRKCNIEQSRQAIIAVLAACVQKALNIIIIYSVATIGGSMLCLDLYGPERYQEQLAKLSTIPMVLAAFSGPAIAFVYDQTGTYNAVLWAGAICCPAMAVITAAIGKRKQKFRRERKQLRADVS